MEIFHILEPFYNFRSYISNAQCMTASILKAKEKFNRGLTFSARSIACAYVKHNFFGSFTSARTLSKYRISVSPVPSLFFG